MQDGTRRCWFHGPDMASALGYARPLNAISKHVEPKWKKTGDQLQKEVGDLKPPANWQPDLIFISNAGVYSLIHNSKLEDAKTFCGWIFGQVLPAVVCDGQYEMTGETNDVERPVRNPSPDRIFKFLQSIIGVQR